MLASRRFNGSQSLKSTNSVHRWVKNLDAPVTKILPNGNEKEIKGSLQKNTRTRQQKRTRGQMANNRDFRLNKGVDYGDASEKYDYSKRQQSDCYENFDSEESDEDDDDQDDDHDHDHDHNDDDGQNDGQDDDDDDDDDDDNDHDDDDDDDHTSTKLSSLQSSRGKGIVKLL